MPILLTTPLDMGAADVDYTHVKVTSFSLDTENEFIYMTVRHGTVDGGGSFVPGKKVGNVTIRNFEIIGPDYDALVVKITSATGVPIYNEVARELYQWLIDKTYYAGTIV